MSDLRKPFSVRILNITAAVIFAYCGMIEETLADAFALYANEQASFAQTDREFENQLARRIDAYQTCVTQNIRYSNDKKKFSTACNDQIIWVNAYGGRQQIKDQSLLGGLNTNMVGLMIGGETPFANKTTVIGGGVGIADYRGSTSGEELSATFNGDIYQFGIYLRQQIAINWRLGAAVGFSVIGSNDTDREVDTELGTFKTSSQYDTNLFNAQARVGYRYNGPYFAIQPISGLLYQRVNQANFTDGVVGFALEITTDAYNSLRSQLGAEFDFSLKSPNIEPFIYLAWEHEFKDQAGSFTVSSLEVPGAYLRIGGAELGRNILAMQAGLAHVERYNWEFSLSFAGRYASGFNENLLVVQLSHF